MKVEEDQKIKSPPPTRTRRRQEKTRGKLIDAAHNLMAEGIEGVTDLFSKLADEEGLVGHNARNAGLQRLVQSNLRAKPAAQHMALPYFVPPSLHTLSSRS